MTPEVDKDEDGFKFGHPALDRGTVEQWEYKCEVALSKNLEARTKYAAHI